MRKCFLILVVLVWGCGDDAVELPPEIQTQVDVGTDTAESDAGADTNAPDSVRFDLACNYTNPFSKGPECREYVGQWSQAAVESDCDAQSGEATPGVCPTDQLLGRCEVPVENFGNAYIFAYGEASACAAQRVGCTVFAKGTWQPEPACDDGVVVTPTEGSVFVPPVQICTEPLAGESAGNGPDGKVCTWQLISGATEENRKFVDYADCGVVRTQRPYYASPRPADAEKDDPRMQDPTYVAELGWVKSQIESSACVCCHQGSVTPDGVSNWDIDQPGNFMNGFFDSGLALGANWVNSIALGAYPASVNNGFDREISGFPSTEPQRMRSFFEAELSYRGKTEADFVNSPPFGGPLYDQIYYVPTACEAGEGIDASGTVTWAGGPARYLYVLADDSLSPTIPPNLDTPDGTIWRLDVAPESMPLISGMTMLGEAPAGTTQRVPEVGMPVLTSGVSYYLYASADVGIPITRCLFVAP